ncbi:winged helix-turn-helix domain-containing protein [Mycolicibacterium goodii]|uniref:winged helix-turn-helix domain-containing protein n=1 Tax=Mycolicibacterium goodii TaxID=134601 RepID=UPI001BDD5763|nr:crosslink repair DNA glycosylase YcaQ family protein [Mycolicibacterium goodii]MBU8813045.1 winged helix DNA-binding domain-containing protein [Mycolicibacterium goodii]MBU8832993.1 winged helix DNA-binding domain-containing protein [Mycolicibacterium goodii]ULN50166.1 winged helix DNA-binding domain-containing protein [Mycolicibacterium goodii]
MATLTAAQARRIAVAAQGFHEPKPRGTVSRAHLRRLISRIQVLQLDSVSVAVRAHYAPVFSRLGPYDRDVLDRAAWSHSARSPRLLVEYWAHEAALMAVEDWPLLRWRMREYTHGRWGREIVKKNPKLADDIVAAVAELGPVTAGQIEAHLEAEPRGRKGPWWDRSETKWVAEALFAAGVLTTATRVGFARHYDLAENVLPPEVLAREVDDEEAVRELALRAATALGVGTEADIRDYFRMNAKQVKPAIAKLVADGELEPVDIDGTPAYLRAGQVIPRRDRGTALLCPFDPLIFFRPRVQRLFDFHYRIEIYVPAPQRQFGYYVWPFLLDGELVGRVDLKRTDTALQVLGAFTEDGRDRSRVAQALAGELRSMAEWLGVPAVEIGDRGDLAPALKRVVERVERPKITAESRRAPTS